MERTKTVLMVPDFNGIVSGTRLFGSALASLIMFIG